VAVVPSGSAGDGHAVRFAKPIPASAAAALRELRDFVDAVLAGDDAAEHRLLAPAFPAPDVPRKQADVSYAPLTEDNLRTACLGGKKSMCVLALVAAPGGEFKQDAALQELARKYRNGAHASQRRSRRGRLTRGPAQIPFPLSGSMPARSPSLRRRWASRPPTCPRCSWSSTASGPGWRATRGSSPPRRWRLSWTACWAVTSPLRR
jgi:hypothetical protein